MTTKNRRGLVAGALATALFLAACGGDDDTTEDSAPTTTIAVDDSAAPVTNDDADSTDAADPTAATEVSGDSTDASAAGDFCADLEALLDSNTDFASALASGDTAALSASVDALPGLVDAARSSAPEELADEMDAASAYLDELAATLASVDLADPDAVNAALAIDSGDADAALGTLLEYASTECGADGLVPADAPEPPACDVLDVAAAIDAAGLDVDATDSDGTSDFNLPGFATKSCSYGNGAISLSTISFNDLDEVRDSYTSTAESNGGSVLDVDLGSLPDSSMATEVSGAVTVTVFEADVPFGVGIPGDADPATVVAAAEAVLAAQG